MFWFMNHILNPFIIYLLRGPFKQSMGASMLVLTCQGKKTGRKFSLPVSYAQEGQDIFIIPAQPESKKWWRNLRGGAPVSITLLGEERTGEGVLWEAADQLDQISAVVKKQVTAFPNLASMYGVKTGEVEAVTDEAVKSAAASLVVVKITLG